MWVAAPLLAFWGFISVTGTRDMLATNDVFWVITVLFVLLIALLWTTKPPFGASPAAH